MARQQSNGFRYIFFDADDTLWENERYFREAERKFIGLLSSFAPVDEIGRILAEKQEENIPIFGYGSKTYLIGMADAAAEICGKAFGAELYRGINRIIRELAYHEFRLIDGVAETLETLSASGRYRLAVATKGDLMEQMNKYRQSGLQKYFHHVEIMENKSEEDYLTMAAKLDIAPERILMVGNSVKSDIVPVINIGGFAIHLPHEVTWIHEMMDLPESKRVSEAKNIREIPILVDKIQALAQELQVEISE